MGLESQKIPKYLTTIFLSLLLFYIVQQNFGLAVNGQKVPEFLRIIRITVAIALTVLILPAV